MILELRYTNEDARMRSQKSNPVPLYAFQKQGFEFPKGSGTQVTSTDIQRLYAGFTIVALEPNTIGLIIPVVNVRAPTLTIVTGTSVVTLNQPIFMDMICHNGFTVVDYGQHLANLYFMPLSNIHQ